MNVVEYLSLFFVIVVDAHPLDVIIKEHGLEQRMKVQPTCHVITLPAFCRSSIILQNIIYIL